MKRCLGIIIVFLLMVGAANVMGQGFKLTQPNAIGGSFVATHLDGLGESSSAGPGLNLFLKYNISPQFFLTMGTGVHKIYDGTLSSDAFNTTLFPIFELKAGYNIIREAQFSPYVFAGLTGFGWKDESKDERYYDGGILFGGGFQYAFDNQWAIHASGDYRYIVTETADNVPKSKHWVAKAGLTYALAPKTSKRGEEIEYPLGEGELSLGDLFREEPIDVASSDVGEEDALSLLFNPEEAGSSAPEEVIYANTEVGQLNKKVDLMKMDIEQRLSKIDELKNQVDNNEKAIAGMTGQYAGSSFGVISPQQFKSNYEEALQKFYSRKYNDAIRQLNGLLSSNPDHRLASNCQYWIGESYNAKGNYSAALEAFKSVMRYKKSYKFDDAMLMTGICYMKMGNNSTAKDNFQNLVNKYPDSEYAAKAMRYIGRL